MRLKLAVVVDIGKHGRTNTQGRYETEVLGHIAVVVVGIVLCATGAGFRRRLAVGSERELGAHHHAAGAAHLDTVVIAVHLVVVFIGRVARQREGLSCAAVSEIAYGEFYVIYFRQQVAEIVVAASVGYHAACCVVGSAQQAVGAYVDFYVVSIAFDAVGAGSKQLYGNPRQTVFAGILEAVVICGVLPRLVVDPHR